MKVDKKQRELAHKIAEQHGVSEVFMNESGSFFTKENQASLSVKHDKKKYNVIDCRSELTEAAQATAEKEHEAEKTEISDELASLEARKREVDTALFQAEKDQEEADKNLEAAQTAEKESKARFDQSVKDAKKIIADAKEKSTALINEATKKAEGMTVAKGEKKTPEAQAAPAEKK